MIELGAGSGVFTRAIIARGVSEEQLVLMELGSDFVGLLQSRFPVARTMQIDATRLKEVDPFEGIPAGAVVSGLPLLPWNRERS